MSNRDHGDEGNQKPRPKKESIIDLNKYMNKEVHVKFQGGREAYGKLKGFDQNLNLVLEDTIEYLRDPEDSFRISDKKRELGRVVCRGAAITVVCPQDGYESVPNPFSGQE